MGLVCLQQEHIFRGNYGNCFSNHGIGQIFGVARVENFEKLARARVGNWGTEANKMDGQAWGRSQAVFFQAKEAIKKTWKTRVNIATQAAIQMQAAEDDLDNFEKFQQDALAQ